MLNRRDVLLTATAAIALAPLGAARAQSPEDARLNALFDAFFAEDLRRRPESATQLGMDKGPNADLESRLGDNSPAGLAAAKAANADQRRRLAAIDRGALSVAAKVNYDTVAYTRRSTAAVQAFDFGGSGFGPALDRQIAQARAGLQSTRVGSMTDSWIAGPRTA